MQYCTLPDIHSLASCQHLHVISTTVSNSLSTGNIHNNFYLSFFNTCCFHIAWNISHSFVKLFCCQGILILYTAFIMYSQCTQHLIFCKSDSDGKHYVSLKQKLRHIGSVLIKPMMKCSECQYFHVLCLLKFPINHRLHNLAV